MTPSADNSDPRDYILDLSSVPSTSPIENQKSKVENALHLLPSLSIHFKCCNVYAPIYKNAASTAYAGHCPRCQRLVQIPISPTGSTSRIFAAE